MKVLHVVPGFPLDYPGGITNYVMTLAKSQLLAGDDVSVLTDSCESEKCPEALGIIQVKHNKLINFSFKLMSSGRHSDKAIEQIKQFNPDIIHIHTIYGLSKKFINDLQHLHIPYLISLHDYYLVCPRIFMMDKWANVCRNIDFRKCSSCIGLFEQSNILRIAAGKFQLNLPTIKSNAAETRIKELSSFVDRAATLVPVSKRVQEIFEAVYSHAQYETLNIGNISANLPKTEKKPSSVIRVSFLGTLNVHKGANLFIELIDYCHSHNGLIEFHFYGRMDSTFEQPLKERGVINHGAYQPSDMSSIMSVTDLGLVLPIWEDNGPQVVMEIINSGTPILATKVGGIPDFVNEKSGYLFHPDKQNEKIAAFDWLLEQTPQTLAIIGATIQRLKTPEEHAREIKNLYSRLIRL